tara:strand:+ start:3992 stop:4318 length:327 start_codon:yes stop_codon:yes gene_type:complete
MARNSINLNRFRKIYPKFRKTPSIFQRGEAVTKETKIIDLSNSDPLTFTTVKKFNSPVVVATAEDNRNVWVASITDGNSDNNWDITIAHSDTTSNTKFHVIIYEGNPS